MDIYFIKGDKVTTCFVLVTEAETCCHFVNLNKINIHNTSCVLTCESALLICILRSKYLIHKLPNIPIFLN